MKKVLFALFCAAVGVNLSYAMNNTADMLRTCEGLYVGTTDNYVLRCNKTEKIEKTISDGMRQFFVADNDGDVRGTFLGNIPDDNDFIYVNVVSNLKDARYENQTCYRFIVEQDAQRDGFYAIEVCEYERPDYYL